MQQWYQTIYIYQFVLLRLNLSSHRAQVKIQVENTRLKNNQL